MATAFLGTSLQPTCGSRVFRFACREPTSPEPIQASSSDSSNDAVYATELEKEVIIEDLVPLFISTPPDTPYGAAIWGSLLVGLAALLTAGDVHEASESLKAGSASPAPPLSVADTPEGARVLAALEAHAAELEDLAPVSPPAVALWVAALVGASIARSTPAEDETADTLIAPALLVEAAEEALPLAATLGATPEGAVAALWAALLAGASFLVARARASAAPRS
eukprot:tig00001376_g8527.t1